MNDAIYPPTVRCKHCLRGFVEHLKRKCLWGPEHYDVLYCAQCKGWFETTDAVWALPLPQLPERYHSTCCPDQVRRIAESERP